MLDEADRLLSLGFADELARVLALLPARRQNLLFSATFPPAVQALAAAAAARADAHRRRRGAASPPQPAIAQRAIEVDAAKRTLLLRHLLETHAWSHVLVFVASRHGADHVATSWTAPASPRRPLHGELSQGARTQALADFKAQRVQVLVATDLAARGLDIAQLPAVVNYDLPRSPGRLRAPHRPHRPRRRQPGVAVSFVSAEHRGALPPDREAPPPRRSRASASRASSRAELATAGAAIRTAA